jgi:short-subunit dehydrogenase
MNTKRALIAAAAAGGAGLAGFQILNRRREESLSGSVVLITGGSRGLGLALAREFASEGCALAICARDGNELERAGHELQSRGATVRTFICDLTDRDQVNSMVRDVIDQYGRLDILVNNAGTIQVGPVENVTVQDFEDAMGVMFWAPVYTTMAALPHMRERRSGRIVNITSIGGKVSIPHLVPYSCAKFAAVALSEGLCAELSRFGIKVTTVVPGLMRTGSHLNAYFKGDAAREFLWFSMGAATPLVSISAERAARSIVRAVKRGSGETILSLPANLMARLHGAVPELTTLVMKLVNRLLPGAGDSPRVAGRDVREKMNSRIFDLVTVMGHAPARRLNELHTA